MEEVRTVHVRVDRSFRLVAVISSCTKLMTQKLGPSPFGRVDQGVVVGESPSHVLEEEESG